jgi:hypothetical protein
MVYVQPTREMAIRGGGGVEMDGRVRGGVGEEWGRKWEVSRVESSERSERDETGEAKRREETGEANEQRRE